MKTLFVFNHPAPYKVKTFNVLSQLMDIQVVFERTSAKDRPEEFYSENEYLFPVIFFKKGYCFKENSISNELKKYIKEHHHEFDNIVMNGYSKISEIKAIRYMIKHKIPYILQINGGIPKRDFFVKKLIKKYYISHASKFLSPSTEANNYLIHYGAKEENIHLYPYSNYFDKDIIAKPISQKEKLEMRKKWNLPDGEIFINPCQFIHRKNNLQLISLFKGRDEHLLLVGSGPEKDNYLSFIKENNMNNVHILDFMKKDELFDLMKCCDAHISLSLEDIYGHTILEAMANGLPVISSTNVVSAKDIIKNGENGYLVDIKDEMSIIKAIENVNDSMSSKVIAAAKQFTIESSAQRIYEILEK